MKTQNTINTEDKVLRFIDGALTKVTIYAVIGSLLAIVLYNGLIQGGFSTASWGL
ncbi:MAG: hypothetical protein WBH49_03420 [Flavobacteriaceae bacterium]